jgi:hypothetical protein
MLISCNSMLSIIDYLDVPYLSLHCLRIVSSDNSFGIFKLYLNILQMYILLYYVKPTMGFHLYLLI